MIDAILFADRLAARFCLSLTSKNVGVDSSISLRVEGIDAPNGFQISIKHGWRSVEATFVPDTFASGLMRTLCAPDPQRRNEFSTLVAAFSGSGTRCVARIDEKATSFSALPDGKWSKFELICSRLSDKSNDQRDSEEVASACLSLLLSLLPTDEIETSPLEQGLPEGALTRVSVNRYERRPANRAACIAAHGASCSVCGFNFGQFYGELGEGFIEVHHRTPVSEIGENCVIDPVNDLVPLCPNCHQMVHRENPPIPVERLKEILTLKGTLIQNT